LARPAAHLSHVGQSDSSDLKIKAAGAQIRNEHGEHLVENALSRSVVLLARGTAGVFAL